MVHDDNLEVLTDFRSVYATVLANYIHIDPVPIIGASVPLLGFIQQPSLNGLDIPRG